ncbi:efflux RND transporter periplasmic adaptor subunit, partial [Yeosuana marina]
MEADERSIYSQSSHIPGRVERLMVNFTGEYIKQGQIIAYIYSPDLVTAQEELFEARKVADTQ